MDEVIKRTAQPATTQDKSLAELTATRWGHFIGYIFRSDPRQKLAISMKAWEDLAKGRIDKPEAIRKTLVGWMLYGIYSCTKRIFLHILIQPSNAFKSVVICLLHFSSI